MSEHFFGTGRGKISNKLYRQIEQIANEHGADFTAADMPEGPRYWFACRNLGEPFDSRTAREVMGAIAAAGIELP